MLDIVVARYREDLRWLEKFHDNEVRVFVYDKGGDYTHSSFNVIHRPNIGREAETWVYHILQHYDSLPDHTVFLQGNPFDHTIYPIEPHIFKGVAGPLVFLNKPYTEKPNAHPIVRSRQYSKLLFRTPLWSFTFSAGAQYIVSKDMIRKRPYAFYLKLLRMLTFNTAYDHGKVYPFYPDTIDPWTMERLWPYIWGSY